MPDASRCRPRQGNRLDDDAAVFETQHGTVVDAKLAQIVPRYLQASDPNHAGLLTAAFHGPLMCAVIDSLTLWERPKLPRKRQQILRRTLNDGLTFLPRGQCRRA